MQLDRIPLPPMQREASHRETDASYRGVIVTYGRYRVALCRDGIQWLFQKRVTKEPCARARWRTLGYFTTRESLMRFQHKSTSQHWPELMALPERFRREGRA